MTRKELEEMLYSCNTLNKVINDLQEQRDYVATNGATESHEGYMTPSSGNISILNDYDRKENEIRKLDNLIRFYKRKRRMINTLLECIKDEDNYKMLEYRYFKKMKLPQIADIYYLDKSTVSRRINKLLDMMMDIYNSFYVFD
ncbi:MAG: hypothetical protein U0J50_01235 [Peptacetobacter hiranonis]|nr:hypothetical protein [Peptacetobacter hiranonis]